MNKIISEYFNAFESKKIETIDSMLSANIVLQDPVVGKLTNRSEVLNAYKDIFNNCHNIELTVKRIYQMDQGNFAAEFTFKFDDNSGARQTVSGVDLIRIENNTISNIRAYLDTTSD